MSEALKALNEEILRMVRESLLDRTRGMTVEQARAVIVLDVLKGVTATLIRVMPTQASSLDAIKFVQSITTARTVIELHQALGLCATPHEMINVYVTEMQERIRDCAKLIKTAKPQPEGP